MDLDNLKLDGLLKMKAANEAAIKTNKEAITKLTEAKKTTASTSAALSANSKDLTTTDD